MKRALVWGSGALVLVGLLLRFGLSPSDTASSGADGGSLKSRAAPPTPATASSGIENASTGHEHGLETLQARLIRNDRLELPQDACEHDRAFYADAVAFAQDGKAPHEALRAAYEIRHQRKREQNEARRKTNQERSEKLREESKKRAEEARASRPRAPGTPPPAPEPLGPAFTPAESGTPDK